MRHSSRNYHDRPRVQHYCLAVHGQFESSIDDRQQLLVWMTVFRDCVAALDIPVRLRHAIPMNETTMIAREDFVRWKVAEHVAIHSFR